MAPSSPLVPRSIAPDRFEPLIASAPPAIGAISDESGAQQRRRLIICKAFRQWKAIARIRDREFRKPPVALVPGINGLIA